MSPTTPATAPPTPPIIPPIMAPGIASTPPVRPPAITPPVTAPAETPTTTAFPESEFFCISFPALAGGGCEFLSNPSFSAPAVTVLLFLAISFALSKASFCSFASPPRTTFTSSPFFVAFSSLFWK